MRLMRSKVNFENYVNNFLCFNSKSFYIEERLGSKKAVWDEDRNLGSVYRKPMTKEDQARSWVFSQVKQSFGRYAKKNPKYELYGPVSSSKKDSARFGSLKAGNKFLATDASHCYWRMARNLGYISENLYEKLCDPQFKLIRNKALACLASPTRRHFYENGKYVNTVQVGSPSLRELYTNVRYKSYALMDSCMIACGKDFLKYKVDGIYYMPNKQRLIESIFKANDMLFETSECMVVDRKYFIEGKNLKKF